MVWGHPSSITSSTLTFGELTQLYSKIQCVPDNSFSGYVQMTYGGLTISDGAIHEIGSASSVYGNFSYSCSLTFSN